MVVFVGVEDLPGLEEQIFEVLKFIDFKTKLADGLLHPV